MEQGYYKYSRFEKEIAMEHPIFTTYKVSLDTPDGTIVALFLYPENEVARNYASNIQEGTSKILSDIPINAVSVEKQHVV